MTTETYLAILKWAEERSGIKRLTPEYEVTAILFDADRITPLDMLKHFSGSNASFFKTLKALEAKEVIKAEENPSDRRSKLYRLSDRTLEILAWQWEQYNRAGREDLYALDDPGEALRQYTKTITQRLRVKQFTCEYQILLYLFASPGLTNIKFHNLVDVSKAKFNMSLVSLEKSGHIYFERDPSDRRKKLYYLSEREKNLGTEMGRKIFEWLNSQSERFAAIQAGKA